MAVKTDSSLKNNKNKSSYYNYDYKKRLLNEQKIDNHFLNKLNFLTLEDLIVLKLESATESLNGKLYGFPLYKFVSDITKEALVRYALTTTNTQREAALVLKIPKVELRRLIKKYNISLT